MPLILEPELPSTDLAGRLGQLRRKLVFDAIVAGIAHIVALALVYFVTVMVADWTGHWPAAVRALALLIGIVGPVLLWHSWVRRPWRLANDPMRLAQRVEAHSPSLQESLSTVVEFADQSSASPKTSTQLLHATHRYAVQRSRFMNFTEAAASRWPSAIGLLSLAAVVVAGWWFFVPKPEIALARLFDPYGHHAWPTKTNLEVAAPALIARGEPFRLTATLTGVIPDRLQLSVHLTDGHQWNQVLSLNPTMVGTETVAIQLEAARIPRSFQFQLAAGDAETDWHKVTVQVPPRLTAIDGRPSPHLHLDFPRYTQLPALNMPDGAGAVDAVLGTQVGVAAGVDRPIRDAAWQWQPTDARQVAGIVALGLMDSESMLAGTVTALTLLQPNRLEVSASGVHFHGSVTPAISGQYQLLFHDRDGLAGHWPIAVRLTTDPSPTVVVEEPNSAGSGLELTPESHLRLRALMTDPMFAVRQVAIEYRLKESETTRYVVVFDGLESGRTLAKLLPLGFVGDSQLRPPRLVIDQRVALSHFLRADGSALQPGDMVNFSIVAWDYDDVTPTKTPGRSSDMELRIVAPDRLIAQQRQVRQGFTSALQELHQWQTEALHLAQEAEAHRRATGLLRFEDREQVQKAIGIQQRFADRLGDERDGLRAAVHRWRQLVMDNPVATPSDEQRANRLADELDRLATDLLPPIREWLSSARQETEPVSPNDRAQGALPEAVRRQRDAEKLLRQLIETNSSGRELAALAAEADALVNEQQQLNQRSDELKRTIPQGVPANRLDEDRQQQLNQAREAQAQLGQRVEEFGRQLEQKSQALHAEAAQEVARAEALDKQNNNLTHAVARDLEQQANRARVKADELTAEAKALEAARQQLQSQDLANSLVEKMNSAADAIAKNQMGAAQERQREVSKQLDQVRDALREPPRAEGDRLAKDRREVEKQLDQLIRNQEDLQDRTSAADQETDKLKRQKQLEELARDQDKLADQARDLAEERRREGQMQLSRELDRAADAMERARQKMDQGDSGTAEQESALNRLDDAAQRAQVDRKESEEQLTREKLIHLHERFQGLVERQKGLTSETQRLFQAARQSQAWSRPLQKSLFDLARAEQDLAQEIVAAADQHLANHRVLQRLAKQAAQTLSQVHEAIEAMRDEGMAIENWTKDQRAVTGLQSKADQRLRQLLAVLQPPKDQESQAQRPNEPGQTSTQEPGDKPAPEMDIIPPDAQIKVLRQMQADLRERVESFHRQHPDAEKWTNRERELLEEYRQEQAELMQLFLELTPDQQRPGAEKK